MEDRKMKQEFLTLPWSLYRHDRYWVPPLKSSLSHIFSSGHPFYETARTKMFMAKADGRGVGRIMAIINDAHNDFHKEECGFFGFFESTNDQVVSDSLFVRMEDYLKEQGIKQIRGPVNPSTNYECGLLVNGFNDYPSILMPYNPPFYEDLIKQAGFDKAMDLLAYTAPATKKIPERILIMAKKLEKRHQISYRTVNMKKWKKEVHLMLDIYNDAWEKNWGFVPMKPKEFMDMTSDLKKIVDPGLILFVMVKGEVAGFMAAVPDYNQVFHKIPDGRIFPWGIFTLLRAKKHIHRCRIFTLGIKKKFHNRGIANLLYKQIQVEILKTNLYKDVELSWILESNLKMNRPIELIGAEMNKTYRIFQKNLSS